MDFSSLSQIPTTWFFVLYLWSIVWKGLALWKSAGLKQKNWFVAMLVLNTIGILDIAYLFFFAKKRMKFSELKFWETK
nr:hypothetical protein [Candidatus Levybacteria bacterium]